MYIHCTLYRFASQAAESHSCPAHPPAQQQHMCCHLRHSHCCAAASSSHQAVSASSRITPAAGIQPGVVVPLRYSASSTAASSNICPSFDSGPSTSASPAAATAVPGCYSAASPSCASSDSELSGLSGINFRRFADFLSAAGANEKLHQSRGVLQMPPLPSTLIAGEKIHQPRGVLQMSADVFSVASMDPRRNPWTSAAQTFTHAQSAPCGHLHEASMSQPCQCLQNPPPLMSCGQYPGSAVETASRYRERSPPSATAVSSAAHSGNNPDWLKVEPDDSLSPQLPPPRHQSPTFEERHERWLQERELPIFFLCWDKNCDKIEFLEKKLVLSFSKCVKIYFSFVDAILKTLK